METEETGLQLMHFEEVNNTIVVSQVESPRGQARIPLDHACKVCGAPASAYLHYGAIVCYSCRAFFRRAIRKNFICRVGDYSCIMEGTRSNRCRGCRYRTCLQVGMKPEMVDAMLKRNPEAGKRRKKADPPMGKVNSTPVFSRSSIPENQDQIHVPSVDPLSINNPATDKACQKFFVFNKSTQSFEPITIISISDGGDGGTNLGQITERAPESLQDNPMVIIRSMDHSRPVQALNVSSGACNILGSATTPQWLENIVTDHEEVVHTVHSVQDTVHSVQDTVHNVQEEVHPVHSIQEEVVQTLTTPEGVTIIPQHTELHQELVVCDISDSEVIQEEIIDSN